MTIRFENFELDEAKFELRRDGEVLAAEPQVLNLLLMLVRHRDRLVSKDEINEIVWQGRFVSDSALASRIKSLRQLLGDDGKQQRLIRTVHGKGFRFVGDVQSDVPARPRSDEPASENAGTMPAKPSIAVLPFRLVGVAGPYAAIADALPHELITAFSRLRWLFVIARGSSFRFRGPATDIVAIGRQLGVRYCLSGTVELAGSALVVTVELAETENGGVIWSERYRRSIDDIHDVREMIVGQIVAALELEIPRAEADRVRLTSPSNLDAWAAYHLGLDHMFRFNARDNAAAQALFEQAVAAEPDFVRAMAGLSFTRFQNAFLRYTPDIETERLAARKLAEDAVARDARDPFANLALGRALWLDRDLGGSLAWLDRATELSPNYAQAIYVKALTATLSGEGLAGQEESELAMALSPLDPLHYAMQATRALAHISCGEEEEGARWAQRAALSPGAHAYIGMIAVAAHDLAGDRELAEQWAAKIGKTGDQVGQDDFFRSFPFADGETRKRLAEALARYGI